MRYGSVPLPGTTRRPLPSGEPLPAWDPDARVELSVRVPRRAGVRSAAVDRLGGLPLRRRRHLPREAFAGLFGADPDALAAVEGHARAYGLDVVDACPSRRRVLVAGALGDLLAAFPADVRRVEHDGVPCRKRFGAQRVPASLAGAVEGILGFESRPLARPYAVMPARACAPDSAAPRPSYFAEQIARLYDFPEGLDGQGECIGLLEFGGGYREDDLRLAFARLGVPAPEVVAVELGSARNEPGLVRAADVEVALDVQVAGAVAPGARIAVYFADWTEKGWVDAIEAAVHDRENAPSVISISWGWAELETAGDLAWTPDAVSAVNEALKDAALLGVTVLCAAGDGGATDGICGGRAHVDFPASSPYVLGCGGTALRVQGSALADERVWNEGPRSSTRGGATGGGVSELFPLPSWQARAGVPCSAATGYAGRGVPDVAGDASHASGYTICLEGQELPGAGGTSAVAPLYAGLVARINQRLGRPVGYLNPLLYERLAEAPGVFRDVTAGDNASAPGPSYAAREGWDACTGWGSIVGSKLLAVLLDEAAAATPAHTTPPPDEARASHAELYAPPSGAPASKAG